MLGDKVIVSGSSCTGKTTLGKELAALTGRPIIDLDDLHFLPDWESKDRETFVKDVDAATRDHDAWIVSGSYQSVLDKTLWPSADTIIWLDLDLRVILARYVRRTYRRIRFKEQCCGENYETLSHVLFKDNMLLHILKTYQARKRRLAEWRFSRFADKQWIVPTTPSEVDDLRSAVEEWAGSSCV